MLHSSTLGEHSITVETGHEFLTEMRDDVLRPAQDGKLISGSRPTNTRSIVCNFCSGNAEWKDVTLKTAIQSFVPFSEIMIILMKI